MSNSITPIVVAKETVSDDSYIVVDIMFENGEIVKKAEIIGSFETSKSIIEIEAPVSGCIHYNVSEGQRISVGTMYAAVSDSAELPEGYFTREELKEKDSAIDLGIETNNIRVSKPVRKLLNQHNIDISVFAGRTILRPEDIHEYLRLNQTDIASGSAPQIALGDVHNSLVIIGGGGHAKMCIDIIRQMGTYTIAGIVDSGLEPGTKVLGITVVGGTERLTELYENGIRLAVVGFGALQKPSQRQETYAKLKELGFMIPNIIHPSAIIEPSARLGEGNQIMAGAIIGSDAQLGNNNITNSGSIISHDSRLANNVHITPGAILAGEVSVGDNSIIGMGSTIMLQVKIGKNVVVSNGSRVVSNVPDNTVLKR